MSSWKVASRRFDSVEKVKNKICETGQRAKGGGAGGGGVKKCGQVIKQTFFTKQRGEGRGKERETRVCFENKIANNSVVRYMFIFRIVWIADTIASSRFQYSTGQLPTFEYKISKKFSFPNLSDCGALAANTSRARKSEEKGKIILEGHSFPRSPRARVI